MRIDEELLMSVFETRAADHRQWTGRSRVSDGGGLMYESYFGLTKKTFSLETDPQFVMLGEQHGMVMALLEYAIGDQAGNTVITGEVGCGKTTLANYLVEKTQSQLTIGMINDTVDFGDQLLNRILLAFGQEFDGGSRTLLANRLATFASDRTTRGRRPVLIVDEAQNLGVETLEQLRLLTNIKDDNTQLVQLILLGQPELIERLRQPQLKQFLQRVAIHHHLNPLDRMDTRRYIRHRVAVAGGDPNLFDDAACNVVYDHSGGVPRLINLLCNMALVYGFARGVALVDEALVEDVIRDRMKSKLFQPSPEYSPPTRAATPSQPTSTHSSEAGDADDFRMDSFTENLDSWPFPLALVRDGRLAQLNSAYASLFGVRSPEQLIDKAAAELVLPEDRFILAAILWRSEFTRFGSGTVTVRAPDGDGKIRLLQLTVRCAVLYGGPAASVSGSVVSEIGTKFQRISGLTVCEPN